MSVISSSELAVVSVIISIIECARNESEPVFTSKKEPLDLLCFVADVLTSEKIDQFVNFHAILSTMTNYISMQSAVYGYISSRIKFESIDSLMDMMESIPSLLETPAELSPNKVLCPFVATKDSLVGFALRASYAKWQLSSFEDIVVMFDRLVSFVSQAPSSSSGECFVSFSDSSLDAATKALKENDIGAAVDHLHAYFDTDDKNIFSLTPDLSPPSGPNPLKRLQQSMLSMASVLITSGNLREGATAVEEAMKVAHKCGDHASVCQSLLLLQYILIQERPPRQSPADLAAIQTALLQLIAQTTDLKLRHITAQARLLLARVLLLGDLQLTHDDHGKGIAQVIYNGPSGSRRTCPQDIWEQLTLAQLGEDAMTEQTIPNTPIIPVKKDSGLPSGPLSAEELGSIPLQAAAVSAELWMRLGLYEMAELECARALRIYISSGDMYREEVLYLGTQLAILRAESGFEFSLLRLFSGQFDQAQALEAMDRAVEILSSLENSLSLSSIEPLYRRFRGAAFFVKVYRAVAQGSRQLALELSSTLLELYMPERAGKPPDREYIRALSIYGELLQYFNYPQAMLELQLAVHLADQYRMVVESGEATLLHTLAQLRQFPYDAEPSLCVARTIRDTARSQTYPALEQHAIVCEELIPSVLEGKTTSCGSSDP